ncbi:hypothetical protein MIR68_002546 [Amoeboaphelidium protococcarum]|nr:hypothetical protein MIR68_002546 [Amoeboaphelidium protococcarum]
MTKEQVANQLQHKQVQNALDTPQKKAAVLDKVIPNPALMHSRQALHQTQKFNSMLTRNIAMASSIVAFSVGVYYYSMYSVKQDAMSDEFLLAYEPKDASQ